jgi:hypothetical protein
MATVYDCSLDQGATFVLQVSCVYASTGAVFPLTDFLVGGQIRKTRKASVVTKSFTCTVLDAAGGVLRASLSATDTAALVAGDTDTDAKSKYVYDIEIYKNDGTVYRVIEGRLTVRPEVTR